MFENDNNTIKKAQQGDKFELEKLIKQNQRTNMEHSKKVQRQRLRTRRFVPNRMCRIYKINQKI